MQNINIHYIENGIRKIKKYRENFNVSKVFAKYELNTDILYKDINIANLKYATLLKLNNIIMYLEQKELIPKTRNALYKENNISIKKLEEQHQKIEHLESKIKLKYKK